MGQPTQHEQQSEPAAAHYKKGYSPREVRSALWYIMVAWLFGASFCSITGGAPLYSFLKNYLQTDDFSFGLVMAAGPVAVLFFLLGSLVVERTGCIKRHFLLFVTAGRLAWLGVAAIALWLPVKAHAPSHLQVLLVGLIVFASAGLMNFGGAGWPTWMSEVIPTSVAGKFFGVRYQTGLISMVLAGIAASALVDRFQNAGWIYAVLFGVGGLLGATDILLFIPIREIPRPVAPSEQPTLRDILVIPWKSALFRSFAAYTTVAWISYMMMSPFVSRYCLESPEKHGLGMSVSTMNLLLFITPWVSMALVGSLWGRAIDKFGPKPALALSSLFAAVLPLIWVIMQPSLTWLILPLSAIGGLTWPGIDQTMLYIQVKGLPTERHSTYNATFLAVNGLATVAGTAIGGWYAQFWQAHLHVIPHLPVWVSHYHPVFLTSMLLRLAAFFLLLPRMQLAGNARLHTVAWDMLVESCAFLPRVWITARRRARAAATPAEKS